MRIPIRLVANAARKFEFFPRHAQTQQFAWLSVASLSGSAVINLIDGAQAPFAYSGHPVAQSFTSLALWSHADPALPVVVNVKAGADGFQGELHFVPAQAEESRSGEDRAESRGEQPS